MSKTDKIIMIGVFVLEALPIPIVVMGWVFALIAPGILVRPSIETIFLWAFLLYPAVWLGAFAAAMSQINSGKRNALYMYAAIPGSLSIALVAWIATSGVLSFSN